MSQRSRSRLLIVLVLAACVSVLTPSGGGPVKAAAARQAAQAADGRGATITRLPDGRWLVAGGTSGRGASTEARIVDPRTGAAIPVAAMQMARTGHTATLLSDGRVLVVGGRGLGGAPVGSAEIFEPASGTFLPISLVGTRPRLNHTATLLSDGRVLIAGGSGPDGTLGEAEVWTIGKDSATAAMGGMLQAREQHQAELLADGQVRISGGVGVSGLSLSSEELFDPQTGIFTAALPGAQDLSAPRLVASLPQDGAVDVALDVHVALRFSQRLNPETVNLGSVSLTGADGPVEVTLVSAEHGRLAFVSPRLTLMPSTTYVITIDGAVDDRGVRVAAASVTFTTRDGERPAGVPDQEAWAPDGNNWRSHRPDSPWQSLKPLEAPPGVTALAGQVLRLDGRPLAKVTLTMEGRTARTDGSGRFLLLLPAVTTGEHTFDIDARTANTPQRTYGFYEVRWKIHAGRTNVLPFTIWSPLIDTAHQVTIPSPTTQETVITTPTMPGLELHLPAGTTILDKNHKAVRTVSLTPIPLDRTPFPLPPNATFTMFFTIQPGGAYLRTTGYRGAWLVYPRRTDHLVGTKLPFFNYDPADKGWYVYGLGTVTETAVVPDRNARLYAFTGASFDSGQAPPAGGGTPGGGPKKGDPVDPSTGAFIMEKTDLSLPDVMPLVLTRTYNSLDNSPANVRPFGIGMTHNLSMFQWSGNQFSQGDLILPDGGRIHFTRTSDPNGAWFTTEMECQETPTGFYKARLRFDGNAWEYKLKDGTVYNMGHSAGLQRIRDRYGNETRLTWSATNFFGAGTGNLLRITSPNGRWIAFTYDTHSPVNRITDATDNLGRNVHYTYDASGHLSTVTDPEGNITTYAWDANHRMTSIKDGRNIIYLTNRYDANGRVDKQTLADPAATYTFAYTTDGSGNITRTDVTNPRGYTTRLNYNASHYLTSQIDALAQPEARLTTFERLPGSNLVSAVVDPLVVEGSLRRTEYTYDDSGNVQSVRRLANTANPVITAFTYEPLFFQLKTVTDPMLHTSTMNYDAEGKLEATIDPLSHQTATEVNSQGQVTSITDALQHTWHFAYSGADLLSVSNPLGATTTRVVDGGGRVIAVRDPSGRVTRAQLDKLNNVTQITDALGGQLLLQYDPNSRMLSVGDALTHATTHTYTDSDQLATRTDPLQRTAHYTYDARGNLAQQVDRSGQLTTYQYDALDRLIQVTYADASTTQYFYDAGNRLWKIIDSIGGTITREYDGLNRLTNEMSPEGSVSYTYDTDGRRATMTVLGQLPITYDYDNAHRLTSITQDTAIVTFGYDNADRRTSVTLPNGVVTTYVYDDANQVTSLTYSLDQVTLGTVTYTYDETGNRTSMGGSWATTSLPQPLVSATYDAANQLAMWGGHSFAHDANGRLINDGLTSYAWNARNQLVGLSGAVTAAFAYDGIGRRRSLTTASTTGSLYDGLNVVQQLVGSTVTANFLTGDVDQSFQRADATGTQALLTDGLGSTMALTNAAGAVHTRYSYEPFGLTTVSGAASGLNATQYTGRENDGTGLYFYRARYYSPQLGRFISEDPIGFAGGLNLFAYVGNSPINRVDPTGLFACKFHKILTQGMATELGYTLSEAMSLAQQVCDVDDRDGASGNNPDTTHHHSMGGRKANGNFETCTEAYEGTKKLLQQLLEQNKLADALHLIQDQWPTGHRFKPWDSYTSWPEGTSASNHWAGDNTPSWDVLRAAGEDTKNLLRDMRNGNATDPSKYLHNFCK